MNLDTIKIKLYHKRAHKKGLNSNLFLHILMLITLKKYIKIKVQALNI